MIKFHTDNCVNLTGDRAIATQGVGEGRMIPVLILDCTTRRDIYDLIISHENQSSGDVISSWGADVINSDFFYLLLRFQRPTPGSFTIKFDLKRHLMLVEGLMQANAAYLQPNEHADTLNKMILIEIPHNETAFLKWDKLFKKKLKKRFKKEGFNGKETLKKTEIFVQESRKFWNIRKKMI